MGDVRGWRWGIFRERMVVIVLALLVMLSACLRLLELVLLSSSWMVSGAGEANRRTS